MKFKIIVIGLMFMVLISTGSLSSCQSTLSLNMLPPSSNSAAIPGDAPSPSFPASPPSQTHRDAVLTQAGNYNLLVLYGNYYEMGFQYGRLLKNELANFYTDLVDGYLIKEHKLTLDLIQNSVDSKYTLFPDNVKQIIGGMADGSGIDLRKLKILSDLTDLAVLSAPQAGCSMIAAWGPYTSGQPLVLGRNFDWWGGYASFAKYFTIVIFHPDDGSDAFTSMGYAGEILLWTGLNSAGLFTEFNVGDISDPAVQATAQHPAIQNFSFLANSNNLAQLDAMIKTSQTSYAVILSVADKDLATSYEWATYGLKQRSSDDIGLLVSTNHFIDPTWTNLPQPNDDIQTETRRNNLLKLATANKGRFSPELMMQILDTPIALGGATQPNTLYQVVGEPGQFKLWVKVRGYADWTEVDLNQLIFNN